MIFCSGCVGKSKNGVTSSSSISNAMSASGRWLPPTRCGNTMRDAAYFPYT